MSTVIDSLVSAINNAVKANGNKEITGNILQVVLDNMVGTLTQINGLLNVNQVNSKSTAYASASDARQAVPDNLKTEGLVIAYKLSSGWHIDQFIGSNISGWETASNWVDITNLIKLGYSYIGVANPSSDFSTYTSKPIFAIAKTVGTYTNFGSIVVNAGEIAILKYNGVSWLKDTIYQKEFNTLENCPFVFNIVDRQFKPRIDGTYIKIKGQLQYGEGVYVGKYDNSEISINLEDVNNWLGSESVTPVLLAHKYANIGSPSSLKLCNISDAGQYPDYLFVLSLLKRDGIWSITNIRGFSAKENPLKNNPYVFNTVDRQFKVSIAGEILSIYGQLQYGNDCYLGKYDGTIVSVDLSQSSNWIGSIANNATLLVKKNGTAASPSSLKLCEVSAGIIYEDEYLAAVNIIKRNNVWYVDNIRGYSVDSLDVEHHFVSGESIAFDGIFNRTSGLVLEDGSLDTSLSAYINVTPVAVNKKYVLLDLLDKPLQYPTYLNCYSNSDFTGFVGRSNASQYQSLGIDINKILYELPDGTNYISFMIKNQAGTQNVTRGRILISDTPDNCVEIIQGGKISLLNVENKRIVGAKPEVTIRFEVPVNVNMLKNVADGDTLEDSYTGNYKDKGILMLPTSYSDNGKPTRLIIWFHGAGGGISDTDSQTEQQIGAKYLVANGFAVMDMNGMPSEWVETWWNDCPNPNYKEYVKVNNMGCPLAMECYLKGLQYVMSNYNIAKDGILVTGGSMGGLSSSNFVMMGGVPVLAQGVMAPVLDTYNQAFLHPWTPVADPVISKYAISKLYDFATEGGDYVYDADKVKGYNPIVNGMQTFDNSGNRISSEGVYDFTTHKLDNHDIVEYRSYPCPIKIWHCDNDPTVNIAVSARHITAIKNAGGKAWLRQFPTGGHDPATAGTVVANPSGNTTYHSTPIGDIYPAIEELYLFFKRFANL